MQLELQITLSVIGALAIVAVLLHGMWKIRKADKHGKGNQFVRDWEPKLQEQQPEEDEDLLYDDVEISEARVISGPSRSASKLENDDELRQPQELQAHTADEADDYVDETAEQASESTLVNSSELDVPAIPSIDDIDGSESERIDPEPEEPASPVYSNVVTQPKPEFTKTTTYKDDSAPSMTPPPAFLLKKDINATQEASADSTPSSPDSTTTSTVSSDNNTSAPKNDEVIDFSLNMQEQSKPSQPSSPEPVSEVTKTVEAKEEPVVEEKPASFAEQAKRLVRRNKKTVAEKIRKEPKLSNKHSEDQMRIDFDSDPDEQSNVTQLPSNDSRASEQGSVQKVSDETDVLVLNVRAPNDEPIQGAALLPMLLTLGFKFGEHDIFHRHVATNGKGPILFSLTNMFKPGVFDIDNIEHFSTEGVSLFMILPIEGDAQQVFNMMHNAARKIADEFSGKVLDANKVSLSKQSLQQYVERIREFERKRKTQS